MVNFTLFIQIDESVRQKGRTQDLKFNCLYRCNNSSKKMMVAGNLNGWEIKKVTSNRIYVADYDQNMLGAIRYHLAYLAPFREL